MLYDVGSCRTKFDFHQTSSSTSSNVSFVLRCERQCCIRSAITFNSVARTHALRLSISMVMAYSLHLFRALPRQFKLRMLNDQSLECLSDESLSNLSSKRQPFLCSKLSGAGRQCICRIYCKSRPRVFSRFLTPAWCKTGQLLLQFSDSGTAVLLLSHRVTLSIILKGT